MSGTAGGAPALVLAGLLLAGMPVPAQGLSHGSMVGSVAPDGALVWARATVPAQVSVLYGTSATLQGAVETGAVTATQASGLTAKVPLSGLSPATTYYYSVRVTDASSGAFTFSPLGSFRTAPDPAQAAPVVFTFSGDIKPASQHPHALFDAMAAESPDFFVSLGDFPYTDQSPAAVTVDEYRLKHKQVRNSTPLQAFFRHVPVLPTWDDHEVANNWDAGMDPVRVANGTTVFKEYFPIPSAPEIWRSVRWGAGLEVFLLDCRLHRGLNAAPDLPGKTMLGAAQKTWLLSALAQSQATFKVVATSVPLRYTGGRDHWQGFIRERREVLGTLAAQGVENVVFVTADTHRAGIHHHAEGFREYMACPLANSNGSPLPHVDREMRWTSADGRSFGVVRVDPSASPPALTVELHGPSGLLRSETVEAASPGCVTVTGDEPGARFELRGPRYHAGGGRSTGLGRVEPGTYTASFAPRDHLEGVPATLDVPVAPAGDTRIATSWRDVPAPQPVLLEEDFDGASPGLAVVDQGTQSGPSSWFTDAGYLYQSSNIYSGGQAPADPGTMAVTGNTGWSAYTVSVRARSEDNDAFGVVFRYQDAANHYRFAMDAQRGFRQLTRTVGGATTVLAADGAGYERYRWYDLQLVAAGQLLEVRLDGETILQAVDGALPSGGVGLYTYANHLTAFDDLVVRTGVPAATPAVLLSDGFEDGSTAGWTFTDLGAVSGPSSWAASGGVLRQTSNVGDGGTSPGSVPMLGTLAFAGDPAWTDYRFSCSVANGDDDGVGVVFRHTGPGDFYRFLMTHQGAVRRLTRVSGGSWSVLWEDGGTYTPGQAHDVTCEARGGRLRIWLDGEPLCDVTDPMPLPQGRIGLYCWHSDDARFDRVLVRTLPAERAVLAADLSSTDQQLLGRAPAHPGTDYVLAAALATTPGIPVSAFGSSDPRVIPLNPDDLFLLSVNPAVAGLLPGFQGTTGPDGSFQASILFGAPLPGLSGTPFFVGGWLFGSDPTDVVEILPSLELRFP